jgi:uncharacterized protein (DUF1778 family)
MPDLTRHVVNLTPNGADALDQAAIVTGDSRTDVINRALMLYAAAATISATEAIRVEIGPGQRVTITRAPSATPTDGSTT